LLLEENLHKSKPTKNPCTSRKLKARKLKVESMQANKAIKVKASKLKAISMEANKASKVKAGLLSKQAFFLT